MSYIIFLSLIAGLATTLGALSVLVFGKPSERIFSLFLGTAGGIMMAIVILDLLPSAISQGSIVMVILGVSLGLLIMLALDCVLSEIYSFSEKDNNRAKQLLKMGYLIAIGISLHDLPEGMAIAVGYSATEKLGALIALAIGLHNIPEGMAIAAPLKMGGMRSRKILFLTILISIFTPLGSFLGYLLVNISRHFISLLLALAAGAMTYIVSNELIPESTKHHPNFARLGIVIGFIFIIILTLHH